MRLILAILAALLVSPASAQVKQSGYVTPGHVVYWVTNGVVGDGGTAANGFLPSLGVTASGPGICQNSGSPAAGGYNQLCFAPTNTGGGFTWNNYNGATGAPSMNINGTVYPFPFTTGGVIGPSTTTIGCAAPWANTTGTLLGNNCGISLTASQITLSLDTINQQNTSAPPATVCSAGSFSCDLTKLPYATGLTITGTSTLGEPASGYVFTPNLSANYQIFSNASGWNQDTADNGGRTGAAANFLSLTQNGQGDAYGYYVTGSVSGAKSGATSFLANPAGTIIGGQLLAGHSGVYLEGVGDINLNDEGYDVAAIGLVQNLTRTVSTAALGETWMGARIQSVGTAAVDAGFSLAGSGTFGIGLDLVDGSYGSNNAAAALGVNQRIYLASTTGASNYPQNVTLGGTYLSYNSGNVGIEGVVNYAASFIFQGSGGEDILYDATKIGAAFANNIIISGQTTTVAPTISAVGSDTNVSINLIPQAGGCIELNGNCLTLAGNLTTSGAYASTFTMTGAYTYTFPGATDTLAGIAAAQTLTNKTIAFASNTLTGVAPLASPSFTGTAAFAGQIVGTYGTPTIASGGCGATTNGTLASGATNQFGEVIIGAATTTSCTIAFSTTLGAAPLACILFPGNAQAATELVNDYVSAITTAHFVLTGTALANTDYYYHCV